MVKSEPKWAQNGAERGQNGAEMVKAGKTTVAEVLRVARGIEEQE